METVIANELPGAGVQSNLRQFLSPEYLRVSFGNILDLVLTYKFLSLSECYDFVTFLGYLTVPLKSIFHGP